MKIYCWWSLKPDLWLGAMPKCGTSSMVKALGGDIKGSMARDVYKFVEPKSGRRVAVIRNPVDRFCSLWRCQARDGIPGIAPKSFRPKITPSRLLDMCRKQDNAHYIKQIHLLKFADKIIKFESLPGWWRSEMGYELQVYNATEKRISDEDVLTQDILRLVSEFYAEDEQAYLNAI